MRWVTVESSRATPANAVRDVPPLAQVLNRVLVCVLQSPGLGQALEMTGALPTLDTMTREPLRFVAPHVEQRMLRRTVEHHSEQQPPGINAGLGNSMSLRLETRSGATRPDLTG